MKAETKVSDINSPEFGSVKEKRHRLILQLIKTNSIETQTRLCELINAAGFLTTQATVCRDIKQLGLIKYVTESGKSVYTQKSSDEKDELQRNAKYTTVLKEVLVSVESAENLVVIRTLNGTANAAGAAIDALKWEGLLGSIAGDDTIFLAFLTHHDAELFRDKMRNYLS